MYNDMFSLIMAAEESILKAELGISDYGDSTTDEVSAMESAMTGCSISGGIAFESVFDDADNSDDYGWGSAMESETESADEKPNIFKRAAAAIVAAFRKLGELFKGIAERLKKWWRDHFNKQIKTAKAQTQATPATLNWKNIPHPNDPADTASGQKVKNAADRYFKALMTAIDGGFRPANTAYMLVDELKAKFFGGKAYTESDHAHTENQLEKLGELIKEAEDKNKDLADAKVEFAEAATPFMTSNISYKQYLGTANPKAFENNLNKIVDTCKKHSEFCDDFAKKYESLKETDKKFNQTGGSSMMITNGDDKVKMQSGRTLDSDLYKVAKEYLHTGTVLNTLSAEYTAACNAYLG